MSRFLRICCAVVSAAAIVGPGQSVASPSAGAATPSHVASLQRPVHKTLFDAITAQGAMAKNFLCAGRVRELIFTSTMCEFFAPTSKEGLSHVIKLVQTSCTLTSICRATRGARSSESYKRSDCQMLEETQEYRGFTPSVHKWLLSADY